MRLRSERKQDLALFGATTLLALAAIPLGIKTATLPAVLCGLAILYGLALVNIGLSFMLRRKRRRQVREIGDLPPMAILVPYSGEAWNNFLPAVQAALWMSDSIRANFATRFLIDVEARRALALYQADHAPSKRASLAAIDILRSNQVANSDRAQRLTCAVESFGRLRLSWLGAADRKVLDLELEKHPEHALGWMQLSVLESVDAEVEAGFFPIISPYVVIHAERLQAWERNSRVPKELWPIPVLNLEGLSPIEMIAKPQAEIITQKFALARTDKSMLLQYCKDVLHRWTYNACAVIEVGSEIRYPSVSGLVDDYLEICYSKSGCVNHESGWKWVAL